MKNIIIKILLILSIFSISGINIIGNTYSASGEITVTVTEKIPGGNCSCVDPGDDKSCPKSIYTCKVKPGFGTVISMMGNIIKYFTFIASLGGVLFIVYNGIMYSMGGLEQSLKDDAKKRIIQTLIGLVLLFLSGVILNLVAPWVYVA